MHVELICCYENLNLICYVLFLYEINNLKMFMVFAMRVITWWQFVHNSSIMFNYYQHLNVYLVTFVDHLAVKQQHLTFLHAVH